MPETTTPNPRAEAYTIDPANYQTYYPTIIYPDELRPGDIITDGNGVYRVLQVRPGTGLEDDSPHRQYLRHIEVFTICGRVIGGLVRWHLDPINVVARRREVEARDA